MSKTRPKEALDKSIYSELFPRNLSKSDKRRLEILAGAIKAYANLDYGSVSFDDVARLAKTHRRLVQHYFPDKEILFETTMKLVRGEFQTLAIETLQKATIPLVQLKEYIRSTFYWIKQQPVHARAWILFFLVCSHKPKLRKVHEELTQMGEQRIMAMLSKIAKKPIEERDSRYIAKTIQRLITGGLIEISSELTIDETERVQEEVLRACLSIAGPFLD